MAYNEQELYSFDRVKSELLTLCTEKQTGDFCLFTAEKHAAVISLLKGDIVGLRYRISRGHDALRLIKGIKQAKIRFQQGDSTMTRASMVGIPSTEEIFKILQIKLNDDDLQGVGKKILVVEDSTTQRKIICKMLSQSGYRTMQASDGYEAIVTVGKEKPDLILLDIIMPGMDGYKVMSAIKEKEGMKNVPIIMLTSRDKLIDKMRGKVSGTNEYLTKPFKSEELIAKIDKYLRADGDSLSNARA